MVITGCWWTSLWPNVYILIIIVCIHIFKRHYMVVAAFVIIFPIWSIITSIYSSYGIHNNLMNSISINKRKYIYHIYCVVKVTKNRQYFNIFRYHLTEAYLLFTLRVIDSKTPLITGAPTKSPMTESPRQNPQRQNPQLTESPRQNPQWQNPQVAFDKIPYDKIPYDKIPYDKIPYDKIPLTKSPMTKSPMTKSPMTKSPWQNPL